MIHALLSMLFCAGVVGLGLPSIICMFPACFYIGREHAQAEYRYITEFCKGKRANMPWYGGWLPKAWNMKSTLDWLLPVVTCAAVAVIAYYFL